MNKVGRPRKKDEDKAKPSDYIECNICGHTFRRNNRSRHNNTKIHKAIAELNDDIRILARTKKVNIPENNKYNGIQLRKKLAVDRIVQRLTEKSGGVKEYEKSDTTSDSSETEIISSTSEGFNNLYEKSDTTSDDNGNNDENVYREAYNKGIIDYYKKLLAATTYVSSCGNQYLHIDVLKEMLDPRLTYDNIVEYVDTL